MEYSVLREEQTNSENVEKEDGHKCSNDDLLTFGIDFCSDCCLVCNKSIETGESQFLPCGQHQCHCKCLSKMKKHLIEPFCPICQASDDYSHKIYLLTLISFLRFECENETGRLSIPYLEDKCTLNYHLFLNFYHDEHKLSVSKNSSYLLSPGSQEELTALSIIVEQDKDTSPQVELEDISSVSKECLPKLTDSPYFLGIIKQYQNYSGYNLDEAIKWFELASEKNNHKMAQLFLGLIYLQRENFDLALIYLQKSAGQNVGQAQFNLGRVLLKISLDSKNPLVQNESFYWIQTSISNSENDIYLRRNIIFGNNTNWLNEAEYTLGLFYKDGVGTNVNIKQALNMFYNGAIRGHIMSQKEIGFIHFKYPEYLNYSKSIFWLKKASSYGDKECSLYIAIMYFKGGYGLKQNRDLSYEYFIQCKDMKGRLAESYLGDLYTLNLCRSKRINVSIGVKYYKIAAEHGEKCAQYRLGLLHQEGTYPHLIPQDISFAIEWFTKSAEQNYGIAQYKLGQLYSQEKSCRDKDLALKWLKLAIQNGYPEAQTDILKL